jgi:hypothetical protein
VKRDRLPVWDIKRRYYVMVETKTTTETCPESTEDARSQTGVWTNWNSLEDQIAVRVTSSSPWQLGKLQRSWSVHE